MLVSNTNIHSVVHVCIVWNIYTSYKLLFKKNKETVHVAIRML